MRLAQKVALLLVSLLAGGAFSQLPLATADDSNNNPLGLLWEAIFDLQNRDEFLQAQIDELRATRGDDLVAETNDNSAFVSDVYAVIEAEGEDDRTLVYITTINNGPDRAAGVKLTVFYLMPLFEINSIEGSICQDKSRGIIECVIGTLEEGQQSVVTIDATAKELRKSNTWTVDVSTTTNEADHSNNHFTYNFETGFEELKEVSGVEDRKERSNKEAVEGANATEGKEEAYESAENHTSTENPGSNSTSGETEAQEDGNQPSDEQTVDDPRSSDAGEERQHSEPTDESDSEESGSESTQEEQQNESESDPSERQRNQDDDDKSTNESDNNKSEDKSKSEEEPKSTEPNASSNGQSQ